MHQKLHRSAFESRRAPAKPAAALAAALAASWLLAPAAPPLVAAAPPRLDLVPYPSAVVWLDGNFDSGRGLRVVLSQPANPELHRLGELAADILRETLGLRPTLVPQGAGAGLGSGSLRLTLTARSRSASLESYTLELGRVDIALSAPSPAGIFYGLQTLRQLLSGDPDAIPSLAIEDTPRFAYRGFYVDRDRETLPVETLEGWIEAAARFKLNTLRWRLSGRSAWRLETLRYPRLSARPAAVYLQEDIRRVIAFASQRYVTVVPEVELAGESGPVVEAYPEMACGDGDADCPNAAAREFAADVLTEMVELFAGAVDLAEQEPGRPGASQERRRLVELLQARGRGAASHEAVVSFAGVPDDLPALYAFDPTAGNSAGAAGSIAGGEAALAPESAPALARLGALAETLWAPEKARDLAAFEARWKVRQADLPLPGSGLASAPISPP